MNLLNCKRENNDSNGLAEWIKELSTREEKRIKKFGISYLVENDNYI